MPNLRTEAVREYFDRNVDEWDEFRYRDQTYVGRARFAGEFLRRLSVPSRILDLGCGTGRQTLDALRAGHHVVAMDVSLEMARDAPDRPALVVVADATALPFRDGSLDAAIALGLIGFVPDREGLCGELRRVLGSGGQIVCDVGNPEDRVLLRRLSRVLEVPLAALGRIATRRPPPAGQEPGPSFYASHFTKCAPEDLRALLARFGFQVIAEGGAGFGELQLRSRHLLPWRIEMAVTRLLNWSSRRFPIRFLARNALIYVVGARRTARGAPPTASTAQAP